ncbi:MAG: transposase [Chloroflexota bacterium]
MGGRNRWHWTFQSKTASYHVIARTRSGSVIDDFLDGAVPDVYRLHWSLAARQSDAYAPQLRAPAKAGQLCLAHQLRELTRAAELEPDAAWWATELRHVFGRGMRLHAERAQISAESFQRRKVRIINAAERLIKGPPLGKGMARRLQQRYQRLWSELGSPAPSVKDGCSDSAPSEWGMVCGAAVTHPALFLGVVGRVG